MTVMRGLLVFMAIVGLAFLPGTAAAAVDKPLKPTLIAKEDQGGKEARKAGKGGAWIGVSAVPLPPPLAAQLDVENGALVVNLVKDSPADRAGIQQFDVITKVGQQRLGEKPTESLGNLVSRHEPGEDIQLTILHKGKEKVVTLESTKQFSRDQMKLKYEREHMMYFGREGKKGSFLSAMGLGKEALEPGSTEFTVEDSGAITAKVNKGGNEMTMKFKNAKDMKERAPDIYDQYQQMTGKEE